MSDRPSAAEPNHPRVLALIPSRGLGGGIESYVGAVLEALEAAGVQITSLVLRDGPDSPPSLTRKVAFTSRAARAAMGKDDLVIIAFLASLAPVAYLAKSLAGARAKAFVIQHGWEIWTAGRFRRRWDASPALHQVAVSSFSAGALAARAPAGLLHPGIPKARFTRLVSTGRSPAGSPSPLEILSVFRLGEAEGKGAYCLIDACRLARQAGVDLHLTIAGRGPVPARLARLAGTEDRLTVLESPPDEQLDAAYGAADVFVLATRTRRTRRDSSGEGFGIVLVEAALAGLPVIAPASGGSLDAYLDRLTGLRPRDESPEALARIIGWVAAHPSDGRRLGANGRAWARSAFDPATYAKITAGVFLGRRDEVAPPLEIRDVP